MSNRIKQRLAYPPGRRKSDAMGPETDDWTTATDRKAKKRIQNRLAQRNYRYRLKKRLEELEQQVHDYEDNNAPQDAANPNPKARSIIDDPTSEMPLPGSFHTYNDINLEHNVNLLPSFSQTSPRVLSSATTNQGSGTRQPTRLSPDIIPLSPDFAPSMGNTYLSAEVPDPAFHPAPGSGQYPPTPIEGSLDSRRQFDKDLNLLSMADMEPVLEYRPAGAHRTQLDNPWKKHRQGKPQSRPIITRHEFFGPPAVSQSSASNQSKRDSAEMTPSQPLVSLLPSVTADDDSDAHQIPDRTSSTEERIEYVISCAKQAGFDSLDSLITAYYTQNFSQTSVLSDAQRMSRHRGLPQVLAEVRKMSESWTLWERNGYEDEILRAAEGICAVEYSQFIQMDSTESTIEGGNDLYPTQRTFQAHLPHLWALLASLTSTNASISHRDRADVVLASMLLPCYWGRVPRCQIISWLKACVNHSHQNSSIENSLSFDML